MKFTATACTTGRAGKSAPPMLRPLAAVSVAILISFGATSPAYAINSDASVTIIGDIPGDVQVQFAGAALRQAATAAADLSRQQDSSEGGPPPLDLSGNISTGPIHQLSVFTEEYYEDNATAPPVAMQQEWMSSIRRDGTVIGTLRVYKPEGGVAQLAAANGDIDLGKTLDATEEKAIVEVPWTRSFYTIVDDIVSPVNAPAHEEVPSAADLDAVQDVMAEQFQEMNKDASGPASVGSGRPISTPARTLADEKSDAVTFMGLAVAALGASGLVVLRRRRVTASTGTYPADRG